MDEDITMRTEPRVAWVARLAMGAALLGLVGLARGPASANVAPPAPPPPHVWGVWEGERPWADGVSDEAMAEARTSFREGIAMLLDGFFARSVLLFRASLARWDHPTTHFAAFKALVNLDRPEEAVAHLWRAMRFGGDPLSTRAVSQAMRYSALIMEQEVAHLVVRCDAPGSRVTRDGAILCTAPGDYEGLVTAGDVTFEVSRPGHADVTVTSRLPAGLRTVAATALASPLTFASAAATPEQRAALERRIVGFAVPWPSAEHLARREAVETAQREAAIARTMRPARPVSPVPVYCERATGDLEDLCRRYRVLIEDLNAQRAASEAAHANAMRRLSQLAEGGLLDRLD